MKNNFSRLVPRRRSWTPIFTRGAGRLFCFEMTNLISPKEDRVFWPFIPLELDDFGLTPAQFRVLCHLHRRAGKDRECYPSVRTISTACKIHRDTVWTCIKELEKLHLIKRSKSRFNSNQYTLLPIKIADDGWRKRRASGNGGLAETEGQPLAETEGQRLAERKGHEGNPLESNPMKVPIPNTVATVPVGGVSGDDNFSDIPDNWEKISVPRLVLPFSSASFSETWSNFKKHRSEIRCALKATGEAAALAKLKGMGESDAISAMQTSIANGWRGLFSPIAQNTPKKSGGTSTYEEEARAHGYTL